MRLFSLFYYMLKHFFFLLISIIALASCGSDDPDGPTPPKPFVPTTAANTVFVFMPYTGDTNPLYNSLLNNINEMEKAIKENEGLGDTHLIVFISKDYKESHLINIGYENGTCRRDTVKTYDYALYSTAEGISSILGDVKKYAPASVQYSMIVGCHGEGWMPSRTRSTRWFGGSKYQINISDLVNGLKNADMSMNYILFDDCYMSTVEVAYDLREVTNYLIASTSEMMAYGMPYHKILKYIIGVEPMPYSGIPDVKKGWAVVKAADCENAKLILDTWHWVRADQPYDILTPEIAKKVISIQINDAYERPYAAPILRDESMHDRLAPGTGAKDTAGFVKMIKDAGVDPKVVGVEVISDAILGKGLKEAAAYTYENTEKVLKEVWPELVD